MPIFKPLKLLLFFKISNYIIFGINTALKSRCKTRTTEKRKGKKNVYT